MFRGGSLRAIRFPIMHFHPITDVTEFFLHNTIYLLWICNGDTFSKCSLIGIVFKGYKQYRSFSDGIIRQASSWSEL